MILHAGRVFTFYTKHIVKDNHIAILMQNSYFDLLSTCYIENLRNNIAVRERNLLAFYNDNTNKFNYYTKLDLKIMHFNTARDYFRFKANGKSGFTERLVSLGIEDSLSNNSGIPDYVHKRLFYAQEDELYFRNRGQHCLGIVVGKHDYKKLTFNEVRRIIPDDVIKRDVLSRRLSQLKRMYKLNTNISLDTLFYQCTNAINAD